ncbi:MAG: hypothetical protein JWO12_300 [Frankiales bacterium]|nr:hypothetical protein [Frankiales bacterium]
MSPSARFRIVPALLVLALAVGCGSTAQQGGTASVGTAGDGLGGTSAGTPAGGTPSSSADGLSVPGGTTGGSGASASSGLSGGAGSTTGSTGLSSSGAGGSSGGGSGGGSGSAAQSGASGAGVSASEVRVGLIRDRSAGALNQATGASGLTSGDSRADELAVIDDINKHGGVAGRKLVPVYAEVDSTSSQTTDQQFSAVCQTFTRDQRVFVATGPGPESYVACMEKAGIPVLDDDLPAFGAAAFRRYPGLIEQGYANIDRLAAYHVGPLVAQKYFTPWNTTTGQPAPTGKAKVGLLTYSDDVFSSAVKRYLVPALQKQGYDPIVIQVAENSTASDVSRQAAAVQSAELTFASRGVTHVVIFEAKAALAEFFLASAQSQKYYPRYAFNSANGPQALLTAGLMTAQQATGSVGYGWLPNLDLNPGLNPDNGPYANSLRRRCAKVMKDHGIKFDSSNAQGIGYIACTSLYLVQAALQKATTVVTERVFLEGVASLGSTFQPAGGLGSDGQSFRPGRNDPQDKAYFMSFSTSCGCFRYTGALQTIP